MNLGGGGDQVDLDASNASLFVQQAVGRKLFIEVANTGHWVPADQAQSTNTGLHALRRRLLIHGGPEATVTTSEHDGWVQVVIQIPLTAEYALPSVAPEPTEIAG